MNESHSGSLRCEVYIFQYKMYKCLPVQHFSLCNYIIQNELLLTSYTINLNMQYRNSLLTFIFPWKNKNSSDSKIGSKIKVLVWGVFVGN